MNAGKAMEALNKIASSLANVFNNLNIYTNLLIDKIIVTKLETRYKMNLEIYFNDGSIKNVYYEN